MKRLINFFRSLFTAPKKVENNNSVNSNEHSDAEVEDKEVKDPVYVDVFGSNLLPGAKVVPISYDDVDRRGYYTVAGNYMLINVECVKGKYINHATFQELISSDKVSVGRRGGFLHVMAN